MNEITDTRMINGNLHISGNSLVQIAKEYGTPIYVFDENKIIENFNLLDSTVKKFYNNSQIAYSVKNNALIGILKTILPLTNWFEVTSLGETKSLLQAVTSEDIEPTIIQTNIYKPDNVISDCITNGYIMAVDSYEDCRNIEKLSIKLNTKAKVLVRANPGIKMEIKDAHFSSAAPWSKCGSIILDREEILSDFNDSELIKWMSPLKQDPKKDSANFLCKYIHDNKNIDLLGIHGHIGSQVTNLDHYEYFSLVITRFFEKMEKELGTKFEILDLGGGYPVDYMQNDSIPSIESISEIISRNISSTSIFPKLVIESGRYIVSNSGSLLTKVALVKENPIAGKIAVLNSSLYSDLLDSIVVHLYFKSSLVNNIHENNDRYEYKLVGLTNDSLDILDPPLRECKCGQKLAPRRKRVFPREIKAGDLILLENAGSYTTCFSSNYCLHSKSPVVLINKSGQKKIIRRKQSHEDIISSES